MGSKMAEFHQEPGRDETPDEAESAILKGLRYLCLEARLADRRLLAETIARALREYARQINRR
jgi:hypothetical protein